MIFIKSIITYNGQKYTFINFDHLTKNTHFNEMPKHGMEPTPWTTSGQYMGFYVGIMEHWQCYNKTNTKHFNIFTLQLEMFFFNIEKISLFLQKKWIHNFMYLLVFWTKSPIIAFAIISDKFNPLVHGTQRNLLRRR